MPSIILCATHCGIKYNMTYATRDLQTKLSIALTRSLYISIVYNSMFNNTISSSKITLIYHPDVAFVMKSHAMLEKNFFFKSRVGMFTSFSPVFVCLCFAY